MHPDCIERLLQHARQDELEAVYGRALARRESEPPFEVGVFPPEHGRFTWAGGMYHAGLRFFQRELFVLCDIYPSPMNKVQPDPG